MAKEYVTVIELDLKTNVETDCSLILNQISNNDEKFWADKYGEIYETTNGKFCVITNGDLNIEKHVSPNIKTKIKLLKFDKIIFTVDDNGF